MYIGLIADTHDRLQRVRKAAEILRAEGVETVLHAGDVTEAKILRALENFDLWLVWGNMDRNPHLGTIAVSIFGVGHMDTVHYLTLEGKQFALFHGDDTNLLRKLIHSGDYDYIIHGHTHKRRDDRIHGTRVINPGVLGSTGWRPGTFAILDPVGGDLKYLEV